MAAEPADLAAALGDGVRVEGMERLSGGASRETWGFRAVDATGAVRDLVLRRDPPRRPGPPGSMGREARAIAAAHGAGLAVPEVLVVDEHGEQLGSAGMVMSRVTGETIARRILRDDVYAEARAGLADQCGRFLAALHRLPVDGLDLGPVDDPLDALRRWYEPLGTPNATFELGLRWLDAHRPPSRAPALVHGDFRLGNLVVGPDGMRAVLDWELVHVGDPLEDLGWLCTRSWRFGEAPPVGGFGTVEQLLAAYRDAGGGDVDPAALHWWQVYGTLRWGMICIGQALVHLSGLQRSVELAAIGRRLCEQEWDLLDLVAPEATAAVRDEVRVEAEAATPPPSAAQPTPGLHGRPTAAELVAAVRELLTDQVPDAVGGRLRFHVRVAANALGIVERELTAGPDAAERHTAGLAHLGVPDEATLAVALRDGAVDANDPDVVRFLARSAYDRLQVANPD